MTYCISVIVACFNGEEGIPKVINSMQNQTIGFENIELIIVDDKSKDNSKKVLSDFSQMHENIKPIFLDKNSKTPGKPRNIGIKEASADYIMFCDQDDSYQEDFCEQMYKCISNGGADLVSSRYTVYEKESTYLNKNFLDKYDDIIRIGNIMEFPEIIYTQANLTIWNKIFRKDFLLKNNIKFVENFLGEDFLFSIQSFIHSNGIIILTKYSGYNYFINDNSLSNKKDKRENFFDTNVTVLKKAEKIIDDFDMDYMPVLSEFLVFTLIRLIKANLNDKDTNDVLNALKKWTREYELTNRLVNISIHLNIFINIFVKLVSISNLFFIYSKNLLKHLIK